MNVFLLHTGGFIESKVVHVASLAVGTYAAVAGATASVGFVGEPTTRNEFDKLNSSKTSSRLLYEPAAISTLPIPIQELRQSHFTKYSYTYNQSESLHSHTYPWVSHYS